MENRLHLISDESHSKWRQRSNDPIKADDAHAFCGADLFHCQRHVRINLADKARAETNLYKTVYALRYFFEHMMAHARQTRLFSHSEFTVDRLSNLPHEYAYRTRNVNQRFIKD